MQSLSHSLLQPVAENALASARYSPRKLVLIHTGGAMALGLLVSILTYVLDLGIAQTGGLSGIGNRATLQTLQTVLSMANTVLLPFWQIGYIFAVLQFARHQNPNPNSLFAGLRHWSVVLRGLFLKAGAVMLVIFFGTQLLLMMTPAGISMMELSAQMAESGADPMALLESEEYMALMMNAMPFLLIGVLILLLPVLYLLRFSDYVMMDRPERGALFALIASIHLTRQNWKALLKLDLRFWWYYALELLIGVISYGHLLLDVAGIHIGIGGDTAMFVFYLVSLGCQLGLYVWKKNSIFTTYALAYDCISRPPEAPNSVSPEMI